MVKEPVAGHILTYNLNNREEAIYVCPKTYAAHEKPSHSACA